MTKTRRIFAATAADLNVPLLLTSVGMAIGLFVASHAEWFAH